MLPQYVNRKEWRKTMLGTSVGSLDMFPSCVLSKALKLKWEVKVNDKCAASPLLCPVLLNLLGSS